MQQVFFVAYIVERILLSRAGGGVRPYETRQPAKTFCLREGAKPVARHMSLYDKSERCF